MIYVFKTSVKTKKAVRQLRPHLNNILPQGKWNFDLADCDRILRVDSNSEIISGVMHLLQANGFDCEELAG